MISDVDNIIQYICVQLNDLKVSIHYVHIHAHLFCILFYNYIYIDGYKIIPG